MSREKTLIDEIKTNKYKYLFTREKRENENKFHMRLMPLKCILSFTLTFPSSWSVSIKYVELGAERVIGDTFERLREVFS